MYMFQIKRNDKQKSHSFQNGFFKINIDLTYLIIPNCFKVIGILGVPISANS